MILFDKLKLGYGSRVLIEELSSHIEGGTLTALVGRNGTGKSTLLRAIVGLQELMGGDIRLQGRSVGDLTSAELAQMVAFVTTDKVRIANLKCRDVVALGRAPYTNWIGRMQEQDRQIVEQSLEMVGMTAFADKTMDQQKVMLARALAQQTPIILLDEPTAFLDMPNRYELCILLGRLAHQYGKAILFSTHELDIALELCDKVALISPPTLHILPTEEMIRSGYVEQLFSNEVMTFDAEQRRVRVK